MKVLITDDDPIVSHMLASRLRSKVWTVELAVEEAAILGLGAAAFLRKPCAPDVVGDVLARLTSQDENPS